MLRSFRHRWVGKSTGLQPAHTGIPEPIGQSPAVRKLSRSGGPLARARYDIHKSTRAMSSLRVFASARPFGPRSRGIRRWPCFIRFIACVFSKPFPVLEHRTLDATTPANIDPTNHVQLAGCALYDSNSFALMVAENGRNSETTSHKYALLMRMPWRRRVESGVPRREIRPK